jgi:zinc protease
MNRIVVFLLLSLIMAVSAMAQEKPKDEPSKGDAKPEAKAAATTPTVDEILSKHVEAVGGKEALQKPKSVAIKGTFDIEALSVTGAFETYQKAPDKLARMVEVPNYGAIRTVYDGVKGWSSEPQNGLRELSGAELAAVKRQADFYSTINFKKNFPKMEVKGKEKVGSSEAYVVEATPAEGGTEKFYFDTATWLLVRHDNEEINPEGKLPAEMYFDDFKVVDGVKLPHSMKRITPMYSLTIKFAEVKYNAEIEEKTFGKPSAN